MANMRHRLNTLNRSLDRRIKENSERSKNKRIAAIRDEISHIKCATVSYDPSCLVYNVQIAGKIVFTCQEYDVCNEQQVFILYQNYLQRKIYEIKSSSSY